MAEFSEAYKSLALIEGGLSTNKSDKGGVTNFGISQRFLDSIIYHNSAGDLVTDVRYLTPRDAANLAEQYFWNVYKLETIRNQEVATKMLDMLFNMKPKAAIRIAQLACLQVEPDCGVIADGIIGPYTIKAINQAQSDLLLNAIRWEAAKHYQAIVNADPSQRVFLAGWLKRAYT